MGIKATILALFFMLFMIDDLTQAAWMGPTEAVSGFWGNNLGQFSIQYGDTSDTFPTTIDVSPSGLIAVSEDQMLERVQIFNVNGQLKFAINTFAYDLSYSSDGSLYVTGGGFRKYNTAGNLVWDKKDCSYDELYSLNTGEVIGYDRDKKSYDLYSSAGQLIKTSATRPLELGWVETETLGTKKYRITIAYPEKTYILTSDALFMKYVRDKKGNIYAVNSGGVWRFNQCGKEIAELIIPLSEKETIPFKNAPEQSITLDVEFGAPIVAPNGDIYVWKKTDSKYMIVKWTWVDDPNVPTGPDAPTNLSLTPSINGLYLTWQASPNDPGCVTKYEIARSTSSGGVFSTIDSVDKGVLKYNDTTAETGTTYFYKVRAMAGSARSLYTAEVSGKR